MYAQSSSKLMTNQVRLAARIVGLQVNGKQLPGQLFAICIQPLCKLVDHQNSVDGSSIMGD
jgi:hypothetical protein